MKSSQFLDLLDLRQIDWKDGRAIWQTLQPLCYRSEHLGATVRIPAELNTDLASVPRVALAYWLAGGRGTRSAVVHDFAYLWGYYYTTSGDKLYVTKADADAVFYESLLADPISGATGVVAWSMYLAVRAGGRGHWNDDGKRAAALNPVWSAPEAVVSAP